VTLLRPPESDAPAPELADDELPELDETPYRATRAGGWRRIVAIVAAVAVGVVLTVALFQGPVQDLWYRNRQHQLAADMNQQRPSVSPGQAVAVLQVPRLGLNVVVVEGDTAEQLRNGPGHRVGTPAPGDRGNSVVAGHRSAWGGPFSKLDRMRKGDLIAVRTRATAKHRVQQTVVYKVTATARTGGGDSGVLRQTRDHRLTLVTGRGGTFSDDRFVVTAVSGTPAGGRSTFVSLGAVSPSGSVIFNLTVLVALVAIGLAVWAFRYLRRRDARMMTAAVVVTPLVVLGALCLLLNLDLLLPPLS
jgi:LPXTG-site transpeptidase (sortase) family protein